MNINIVPTGDTKRLIEKLNNAGNIVRDAKVKGLTTASMIFTTFSKQIVPVATGNLRRNIKYKVSSEGNNSKIDTGTVDYAIHQEYGTGIYGRRGRMIVPKRAKMLRFKNKAGKIIFAKAVRGVKGKFFMQKGSEETARRNKDIDSTIYKELQKGLYA